MSLQFVQRTLRAKQRDQISPGFSLRTAALPSQRTPWALEFLPRDPKRSNAPTDFADFNHPKRFDSSTMTLTSLSLSRVVSFGGRVQVKIKYSIFMDGCKEKALVGGLAPKKRRAYVALCKIYRFSNITRQEETVSQRFQGFFGTPDT